MGDVMAVGHIELNRTFWEVKDQADYDEDTFAFSHLYCNSADGWSTVIENKRVIILAEAGTGKTHEVLEAARKLAWEGKAAFFCRIEDLADVGIEEALIEGNYEALQSWKQTTEDGWFFLDSVDEARLANERFFERALRRIAKELGDSAPRAHIFITSRVSDWMATADRALVQDVLPCPEESTSTTFKAKPGTGPAGEVEVHKEDKAPRPEYEFTDFFRSIPLRCRLSHQQWVLPM